MARLASDSSGILVILRYTLFVIVVIKESSGINGNKIDKSTKKRTKYFKLLLKNLKKCTINNRKRAIIAALDNERKVKYIPLNNVKANRILFILKYSDKKRKIVVLVSAKYPSWLGLLKKITCLKLEGSITKNDNKNCMINEKHVVLNIIGKIFMFFSYKIYKK
jgi:hypothetical protein